MNIEKVSIVWCAYSWRKGVELLDGTIVGIARALQHMASTPSVGNLEEIKTELEICISDDLQQALESCGLVPLDGPTSARLVACTTK